MFISRVYVYPAESFQVVWFTGTTLNRSGACMAKVIMTLIQGSGNSPVNALAQDRSCRGGKGRSLLFPLLCAVLINPAEAEVFTYPAPEGEELSERYSVKVDGKKIDVYLAPVTDVDSGRLEAWMVQPGDLGKAYSFATFDFSGSVTVTVRSLKASLKNLVIRPESAGVKYTVKGDTIQFQLDKPCTLSIEPKGRINPLLLFANAPEVNPPDKDDPNVIYFGPGIHKPEKIHVGSGQTLYIAGGAVVKGGVEIAGENVTVSGRGILCGADWPWREGPGNMIRLRDSKNITIRDVILRGSWSWTIVPKNCDDVLVENVKICGSRCPNDDGINPVNSRNVTIRNCFIRTDDDCIAMKGLNTAHGNVENIVVEDCLLWSDRARIFLLGHESRAEYMRDIIIRNLDILHMTMTPFLIEPGEEMTIENVLIENVRCNAEYWGEFSDFIRLRPVVNQYMETKVPGRINGMHFKNVTLDGEDEKGRYEVWIEGHSEGYGVTNIKFENISWFGEQLDTGSSCVRIKGDANNIVFK